MFLKVYNPDSKQRLIVLRIDMGRQRDRDATRGWIESLAYYREAAYFGSDGVPSLAAAPANRPRGEKGPPWTKTENHTP